jgi:uncharacterized protein (TIGR00251 family)
VIGRVPVHVVPRARRTELAGVHGEAIRIRVAAPPADGEANAELIRFVARHLGVPRSAVAIAAGAGSRHKVLAVQGLSSTALRARLAPDPLP